MRPFLHGGETIRVSPLAGQIPKIGEILFLCDSQGSPLVHRLVRRRFCKGNTYLQTKGDACLGFDGFVPSEQVLGRVRQIISHSENDLERIKSLGTFFMRLRALMVVGLSLIFYYLRRAGIIMKIRGDS
ncbi:MAG: hypothetical protein Q3M30_01350 [Candidatus Electrothrix sp. Rat3]|nr:hypothetical protein [Candidatus Electrothrix rattekaaiensis]